MSLSSASPAGAAVAVAFCRFEVSSIVTLTPVVVMSAMIVLRLSTESLSRYPQEPFQNHSFVQFKAAGTKPRIGMKGLSF